jgi:hypothetical protein
MSIRKYWRRHPVQLRALALVLLIVMPAYLPIIAVVQYWRDILDEVAAQYRETWRVLIKGIDA